MRFNWKIIGAHVLFWILYIIIWGIRDTAYAPTFLDTVDGNLIGSAWYAIGVYVNLYVLVPHVLLKKKRWLYAGLMLLLTLLVSYGLAQTFAWHYHKIHQDTSDFFNSVQGVANTASDFLVVYGLATCLYFINEWYIKERKLRELESQTLQSELNMLKRQINPHFLFNALNTIHVLIRKDPNKAGVYLEKFSDLLSHQLYEMESQKIPLEKEIKNLKDYVEIQKLRFGDHVKIDWSVKGHTEGHQIAPMIFLNFVENAFKHGDVEGNGSVDIHISFKIEGEFVLFECQNSTRDQSTSNKKLGVGISNVRRRLELLYPEKHDLAIEAMPATYIVKLKLDLDEA